MRRLTISGGHNARSSSMRRYFESALIVALVVALVHREEPHDWMQSAEAQPPTRLLPWFGSLRTTGATREKLLKDLGGSDKSEAAVTSGLKWIVGRQNEDGSWDLLTPEEEAKKPYPADSKVMRSVA